MGRVATGTGIRRALAVAAVALLLAACGGNSTTEDEPTATPAAAPTERSATATPTRETDVAPTATFEPGHEPLPIVDVAQVAAETGCPMTPYDVARILGNGEADIYYDADGLRLSPYAWLGRWYAGDLPVSWRDPDGGPLTVTATRRADGLTVEDRDIVFSTRPLFNRLTLPEAGCWDVRATLGNRTLEVTVYAYPLSERPDIAEALDEREDIVPYPVPATCAVSPFDGPRDDFEAHGHLAWWVTGDGARLEGELDLLFEGDNELRLYPEQWGDAALSATSLDDPSLKAIVSQPARRADFSGEHAEFLLYLPAPGCWNVEAAIDSQTVSATIYAYPARCRPEPGYPTPACEAP